MAERRPILFVPVDLGIDDLVAELFRMLQHPLEKGIRVGLQDTAQVVIVPGLRAKGTTEQHQRKKYNPGHLTLR